MQSIRVTRSCEPIPQKRIPLFSVVMPTYKVDRYVDEAFQSLLNQTCADWEAVAVDDGSPDACGEILDSWARKDKRIRVIHQRNRWVCAARNRGIASSTGDFITFLDPDDAFSSEWFEVIAKLIEECNPDLISLGRCNIPAQADISMRPIMPDQKIVFTANLDYVRWFWGSISCYCGAMYTKAWRRSVFKAFPLKEGIRFIGEDVLFNWETSLAPSRVVLCDYRGYLYRQHSESVLHRAHLPLSIQGFYERTKALLRMYHHVSAPQSLLLLFGYSTYLMYWIRYILSRKRIPDVMNFPDYLLRYIDGEKELGRTFHVKMGTSFRWLFLVAFLGGVGFLSVFTRSRCRIGAR